MTNKVVVCFEHDVNFINRNSSGSGETVVLTNYISQEKMVLNCKYYWFDDFIPKNFDEQLKSEGDRCFEVVLQVINSSGVVCPVPIGLADHHFVNKVVRVPLMYSLAVDRFLRVNGSDGTVVYAEDMRFCLASSRIEGRLTLVAKALAYCVYELLLLPLLSRVLFFKSKIDYSNKIIIGNLNEINGLLSLPELSCGKGMMINLFPMRRFYKLKKFIGISGRIYHAPLERFLGFIGLVQCLASYAKFLVSLDRVFRRQPGIDFGNINLSSVYNFFLYFSVVAIKYNKIFSKISKKYAHEDVYFTYPHTWQVGVINQSFKNSGVCSVTSTHGLIQEPLLMTSRASVCYAFNKYDAELLRKYSSDDRVVCIRKDVALNDGFSTGPLNGCKIKVLVLGKLFYSDAPAFISNRYFDIIREAFECLVDKFDVTTSYRPHPREPSQLGEYMKRSFLPKNVISDTRPFDVLRDEYDIYITPSSTALIDLMLRGFPVLAYKSGYDSDSTFFSGVSDKLKFENSAGLIALVQAMVLGEIDFKSIYHDYFSTCFENPPASE